MIVRSSMARGTTGQALNVVFLYELSSEFALIRRGLIAHLKHLFFGTHVHAGITMAVKTPGHGEILRLPHERHPVYAAVTALTANPLVHVNTVIEIDKLRQVVNPDPRYRLSGSVAFSYGFQDGRHCPHLRMAVHANLSWRDIGKRTFFDRRVTVAAVDAETSDVMLVTEGDWLTPWNVLQGFVRRPNDKLSQACH